LLPVLYKLLDYKVDPFNSFSNDIISNLCENNEEFSNTILNNAFDKIILIFMSNDKPKVKYSSLKSLLKISESNNDNFDFIKNNLKENHIKGIFSFQSSAKDLTILDLIKIMNKNFYQ
jgi:hypothetical protein